MKDLMHWTTGFLCVLGIFFGKSVLAESLGQEAMKALLNDKTWAMVFHGAVHYWDWKADGSMCVRGAAAQRGDRCLDIGQWRFEGNKLCWKLQSLYVSGINATCVRMKQSADSYLAERVEGYTGYKLYKIRVLD